MYPLIFNHILKNKIWGGDKIQEFLSIDKTDELIGEAWEISARDDDKSIIQNGHLKGKTLNEVYEEYKDRLVGKTVYDKYGDKFPVLIKFLDVNDRLSIQVHPNDEYALPRHNDFGKNECWYVISASDDATILLDINPKYSKQDFIEKTSRNDFSNLFVERKVKQGDFIDITPGTVHASIRGSVFLAEIQQNSDVTYRIYDFDRLDNGKKRELHLEDAINVIDFNKQTEIVHTDNTKEYVNLTTNKFFSINKRKIDKKYELYNKDSMIILINIEGSFQLKYKDSIIEANKGQNILIPANMKVEIEGQALVLETYMV